MRFGRCDESFTWFKSKVVWYKWGHWNECRALEVMSNSEEERGK